MLPGWKGLDYVAYLLLKAPGEAIHGSELGERVCGDAVIEGQRNLAADDEESFEGKRKAQRECQQVIDDPDSNEAEKQEARAEIERIEEWARRRLRGTEGGEQKQVRAIRQAIRRVLENLERSKDKVWRLFGEHLDRHLWKPSGRSRGGRSSRMRAGLAGRFVYEPPDGVKWSETGQNAASWHRSEIIPAAENARLPVDFFIDISRKEYRHAAGTRNREAGEWERHELRARTAG